MQNFLKNIIKAVQVDLSDEFDKNFERKAFFDKSWPTPKLINKRGSMMARTNNLRRSIQANVRGNSINFSSSLPYASLHNEGGETIVTEGMKRFFWAMYYKSSGAIKGTGNNQRNRQLSAEASQWKALALQKVGKKMKIDKRQFIGDHPQMRQNIERIVGNHFEKLGETIFNNYR